MGPGVCVATTTVMPSSRLARKSRPRKPFSARGSSMLVGSSRRSSRGRITREEARASTCRWPPESSAVRARNHGSMPRKAQHSATRRRISGSGTPRFSRPKAISCQTVSQTTWASGLWKTWPTARADSTGPSARTGSPKTRTSPERAPAGAISGLARRRSVDFPDPVAPTSSAKAPSGTSRQTSRSTGSGAPAYEKDRWSSSSALIGAPPSSRRAPPQPRTRPAAPRARPTGGSPTTGPARTSWGRSPSSRRSATRTRHR